ncbi:MAG: hypothetical protein HKM89_04690 [Gemmatimonadales bacterium]|nr:hypothetical protein [Gemmatimonadales bacterium]
MPERFTGEIRIETFAPLVGEMFCASVDDEVSLELELTEATVIGGENRPDEAFSLLFKGPSAPFLTQRTYEIAHGSLGELPIFLVPVGQTEDGFVYQAIFTRLKESQP